MLQILVVDEGQRRKNHQKTYALSNFIFVSVKSDSSLLFKKLNELNTLHRIIMTGVCNYDGRKSTVTDQLADSIEQQHQRTVQFNEFPRSCRVERSGGTRTKTRGSH